MRDILVDYLDKEIGINCIAAFNIESAKLVDLATNYFTVVDHRNEYKHHFSYRSIVQILEHPDGVEIGGFFTHKGKFPIVVKVGHLMEYAPG